ncbi:GTPase IMAP family member GIMD1-like [Polymixia lowei]
MDPNAKDSQGYQGNPFSTLGDWGNLHSDRRVLDLNVLLLGDRQSGRSSVGNALIGGQEFPTGTCVSGVAVTTECQLLCRTFQSFFRRKGEETDLRLRVIDTPPLPCPSQLRQSVCRLSPEGVHVVLLVVRADLPYDNPQLAQCAQTLFGPDWFRHALLVLTHVDHLREAGLKPSLYITQTSDSLRALADTVGGGALFLDNGSDWPVITGKPLRERLLSLSAGNHHCAMKMTGGDDLAVSNPLNNLLQPSVSLP